MEELSKELGFVLKHGERRGLNFLQDRWAPFREVLPRLKTHWRGRELRLAVDEVVEFAKHEDGLPRFETTNIEPYGHCIRYVARQHAKGGKASGKSGKGSKVGYSGGKQNNSGGKQNTSYRQNWRGPGNTWRDEQWRDEPWRDEQSWREDSFHVASWRDLSPVASRSHEHWREDWNDTVTPSLGSTAIPNASSIKLTADKDTVLPHGKSDAGLTNASNIKLNADKGTVLPHDKSDAGLTAGKDSVVMQEAEPSPEPCPEESSSPDMQTVVATPTPQDDVCSQGSDDVLTVSASDAETAASGRDAAQANLSFSRRRLCMDVRDKVVVCTEGHAMVVRKSMYRDGKFKITPTESYPPLPQGYRAAGSCLFLEPHEEVFEDTVWVLARACPDATMVLRSTPSGQWEALNAPMFREGYAVFGVNHFCHVVPATENSDEPVPVLFTAWWNARKKRVKVVLSHDSTCESCRPRIHRIHSRLEEEGFVPSADGPAELMCVQDTEVRMSTGDGDAEYVVDYTVCFGNETFPDESDALPVVGDSPPVVKIARQRQVKRIRFDDEDTQPVQPPSVGTELVFSGEPMQRLRMKVRCDAKSFKELSVAENERWPTLYDFFELHRQTADYNALLGFVLMFFVAEKYFEVMVAKSLENAVVVVRSTGELKREGRPIEEFLRDQVHNYFGGDSNSSACHRGHGKRTFGKLRIVDFVLEQGLQQSSGQPLSIT